MELDGAEVPILLRAGGPPSQPLATGIQLSTLPIELQTAILGWLSPEDLLFCARVCRTWRVIVGNYRRLDVAHWYKCATLDDSGNLSSSDLEDFTDLEQWESVMLCTCGSVILPNLYHHTEMRDPERQTYRDRHAERFPPARWAVLRPQRELACDLALSAAAWDQRLLEPKFLTYRCKWMPVFVYLPQDVHRPTTSPGLRRLVQALMNPDDSHESFTDDAGDVFTDRYRQTNIVRDLFALLSDSAAARLFYASSDAESESDEANAEDTSKVDQEDDEEDDNNESAPLLNAPVSDEMPPPTKRTKREPDGSGGVSENPSTWLDAWRGEAVLYARTRAQRAAIAAEAAAEDWDREAFDAEFYRAFPTYREGAPISDVGSTGWDDLQWLTRLQAARLAFAIHRNCRVAYLTSAIDDFGLAGDQANQPFVDFFMDKADQEVLEYFASQVAAIDGLRARFDEMFAVHTVVRVNHQRNEILLAGLSAEGHLVGAISDTGAFDG